MNIIVQAPVNFTMLSFEMSGFEYGHWHDGWANGTLIDWNKIYAGVDRCPVGGVFLLTLEGIWSEGLADPALCMKVAGMIDIVVAKIKARKSVRVGVYGIPMTLHNEAACLLATRKAKYICPECYNFTPEKIEQVKRAFGLLRWYRNQEVMTVVSPRYLGGFERPVVNPLFEYYMTMLFGVGVRTCYLWDDPSHVAKRNPLWPKDQVLAVYESELLAAANAARGVA